MILVAVVVALVISVVVEGAIVVVVEVLVVIAVVLIILIAVTTILVVEVKPAILLLVGVVARALVCAGVFINIFAEVSSFDMRVDVVIIVPDMAVEMDALTGLMRVVLTNIDVDVLMDVNANVFAGVMTAFEFVMPDPLEEFLC